MSSEKKKAAEATPMTLNTIHHGESLAWLRSLPTHCADAVITDPPYSSGGMMRGDRVASTNSKYLKRHGLYHEFTGDNRDQHAFDYWCALWLSETLRVTKPGGMIGCFTDWRQLATTTDALQAGGWIYRGIFVWDKTEAVRPILGRFRAQCEFMAWGSNGPMAINSAIGALPGVVRKNPSAREKLHTTSKPLDVMKTILRIVPENGVVLDPFAGSGTTLLAAKLTGRRYLGCELSKEYHAIATERLRQSHRLLTLDDFRPGDSETSGGLFADGDLHSEKGC